MPYQEVWVDDLELGDCDDDELIDELENRDYIVYGKGHEPNINRECVEKLYTTYTTMPSKFFEKELKKFFLETLDVYVR